MFITITTGKDVESEGNDRADINLPGKQLQLLQDAASAASGKLQGFFTLLTDHGIILLPSFLEMFMFIIQQ